MTPVKIWNKFLIKPFNKFHSFYRAKQLVVDRIEATHVELDRLKLDLCVEFPKFFSVFIWQRLVTGIQNLNRID